MTPLRKSDLTGTWATVLLPLDDRDRVDWAALTTQVDRLTSAGVHGVYTNGSAAEFWAQTEEEFDRLSRLVAERCATAGVGYQIGATHTSPQLSLDRVRRAKTVAPGAIQVILPDWFPVSLTESVTYLRAVAAAASPVPLVLYNPPHAKRVLTGAQLVQVCAQVPEVVGVKVGDTGVLETPGLRDRVAVFVPGHELASGAARGAAGSYSNVACLNPEAAVAWGRRVGRGDPTATETERGLRSFLDRHVTPLARERGLCNAALDKLLAAAGGWTPLPTRLRWPYQGATERDTERVRAALAVELPEFLTLGG